MPNSVRLDQDYPSIERSNALQARAKGLSPAFTQTLAKGPTQWVDGVAPRYLERGKGCRVWDVDGNEFIDLTMAVGPLSLGYGHPEVDAAIREQLDRGITFSLVHPLEIEVAERVRRLVPGAESVRFSKTGCDVTSAAVRLARAFTGRDRVLMCGYHGWHDWAIGTTSRSAGVPEAVRALTTAVPYDDLDAVRAELDDVACVILEPMIFDAPRGEYLRELRRICHERGALLVFDEMWTGFRLALGGAQQHFDVTADLACFSKAVANGMPLSVLTGRAEVMKLLADEVFFFTTFGGEALSLAAARATLDVLERERVPEQLARTGAALARGWNERAEARGLRSVAIGAPSRTMASFDAAQGDSLLQKSLVQQELLRHGVLWGGFHNVALAHGDVDVRHVLAAYDRALDVLADAVKRGDLAARLRGAPLQAVFRKTR